MTPTIKTTTETTARGGRRAADIGIYPVRYELGDRRPYLGLVA